MYDVDLGVVFADSNTYPAFTSDLESFEGYFQFDAHQALNTQILTITYDGNGHTGGSVPASHVFTVPGYVTLGHQGNMIRVGYRFGGWQDINGNIFSGGFTWFVSSGGTVPANHSTTLPGDITLPNPGSMVRAGHTFGGWRNGNNVFPVGTIFNQVIESASRYYFDAVWNPTQQRTSTFIFRSNGHTEGMVPPNRSTTLPGYLTLPAQETMVKAGHTFDGWRNGNRTFQAGTIFGQNLASAERYYFDAIWTPVQQQGTSTFVFRGNGHTGGIVPINRSTTLPGDIILPSPGSMVRAGYTFSGWRNGHNVFQAGTAFNQGLASASRYYFDAVWVSPWYSFTVQNGVDHYVVYLSSDGRNAVYRRSNSSVGTALSLNNDNQWVRGGAVQLGGGGVSVFGDYTNVDIMPAMVVPPHLIITLIDMHRNAAIGAIETQFFAITGIDRATLSDSNAMMITRGIANGVDDNMFFGLGQVVASATSHDYNYFYLRAKTITHTFFIAHYAGIAGVSAVAMINALGVAGALGKFAVATAPTGVGPVGGGVAAAGALVTAVSAGAVSLGATVAMSKSIGNYERDMRTLNATPSGRQDIPRLAGRGNSGGRTTPNNLNEQLAMQEVMSDPLRGSTKIMDRPLSDPRWLGSEGWVKKQRVFHFSDGTHTTIHFNFNEVLHLVDDFKFVFP